jgi:transcriptional regulator with XRE-family HTH domain
MDPYNIMLKELGRRAKQLRVLRNLQQAELASRAGLTRGTVARFENSGRASIENVLRIATALGAEDPFGRLFEPPKYRSIDDALARPASAERQRVRRRERR